MDLRTNIKPVYFVFFFITAISITGCLKTRTPIRNSDDAGYPQEPIPQRGQYALEEVKSELLRVSGRVEELHQQFKPAAVEEMQENVRRLEQRLSEMEKNQLLIFSELKNFKDGGLPPSKNKPLKSPASLLNEAKEFIDSKSYVEASELLNQVLDQKISPAQSAEAHFLLGECEYGQKNYKKSIVQYSKVQEVDEESARIPVSLYKIGLSFQSLKMNKEAKGFFRELVERFPKSPEAKKAKSKLN